MTSDELSDVLQRKIHDFDHFAASLERQRYADRQLLLRTSVIALSLALAASLTAIFGFIRSPDERVSRLEQQIFENQAELSEMKASHTALEEEIIELRTQIEGQRAQGAQEK